MFCTSDVICGDCVLFLVLLALVLVLADMLSTALWISIFARNCNRAATGPTRLVHTCCAFNKRFLNLKSNSNNNITTISKTQATTTNQEHCATNAMCTCMYIYIYICIWQSRKPLKNNRVCKQIRNPCKPKTCTYKPETSEQPIELNKTARQQVKHTYTLFSLAANTSFVEDGTCSCL